MQQTCMRVCRHTAHQCVFLVRLFYTHSAHTPTHTPQSCTDSVTLPLFFIYTPHRDTHTDIHMPCRLTLNNIKHCYWQTHTHACTHSFQSHREDGVGEQTERSNPCSKSSLGAHSLTHIEEHTPKWSGTKSAEAACGGTSRNTVLGEEEHQATHSLQSTFSQLQCNLVS